MTHTREDVLRLGTTARDRRSPRTHHRLRLLDGFELTEGEQRIDVPTSAQRVLAFLALHDRSVMRHVLAGTLWPDATDARALASLRSALWRVHRVAIAVVGASADRLYLTDLVEVDVRRSEARAHRILDGVIDPADGHPTPSDLTGVLLPGWSDEWVSIERERSQQLRMHALERVSELALVEGRFGDAVDAALAVVDEEPLRESAHRALIKAYLAEGNAVDARIQYDRCRRLLEGELHVRPSDLMEDLATSLR
jgi:DNA-binding SARP family transcriptional activator